MVGTLDLTHAIGGVWLLGLTCAILFLWARTRRLQEGQRQMQDTLQLISHKLDNLAQAQQVDDLRRDLQGYLDVRLAGKRRGKQVGVEFGGAAIVHGPVAGHDVGESK